MPIFASHEAMLESLQGVITKDEIQRAFQVVKRNYFVPPEQEELALCAYPFPIRLPTGRVFNMSAINIYAVYMEYLDLKPNQRVLDIGSGTCFSTALLRYLVGEHGQVDACDLFPDIIAFGKSNLLRFQQETSVSISNINLFVGNGLLPTLKKYDRIYCGASCPEKQLHWLYNMLDRNGILVTPCGDHMLKVVKDAQGQVTFSYFMDVRFGELVQPSTEEVEKAYANTCCMYSKFHKAKRNVSLGFEDVHIIMNK